MKAEEKTLLPPPDVPAPASSAASARALMCKVWLASGSTMAWTTRGSTSWSSFTTREASAHAPEGSRRRNPVALGRLGMATGAGGGTCDGSASLDWPMAVVAPAT